MPIVIDDRLRVQASHTIDLPMSARAVWGQMRDVRRFITWDPLHRAVHLRSPAGLFSNRATPRGAEMVIEHRLCGIGPDRLSRIVWWEEGRGFAFSDLSNRGRTRGFPHICMYELDAIDVRACRLTVSARGRWTARFIPRWAAKLWLGCVLVMTGIIIRLRLAEYRAALNRNVRSGVTGS